MIFAFILSPNFKMVVEAAGKKRKAWVKYCDNPNRVDK